jgi:hypothetical protein
VRTFNNEIQQQIVWYKSLKNNNVRTAAGHCLQLANARDQNLNTVTFTNPCHGSSPNWSGWFYDLKDVTYPKFPVADGVKFQIKSAMDAHRAVFSHEHIGSNQFRLRIRANDPDNNKQWFVHDSRTKTIRANWQRNYVLANQLG